MFCFRCFTMPCAPFVKVTLFAHLSVLACFYSFCIPIDPVSALQNSQNLLFYRRVSETTLILLFLAGTAAYLLQLIIDHFTFFCHIVFPLPVWGVPSHRGLGTQLCVESSLPWSGNPALCGILIAMASDIIGCVWVVINNSSAYFARSSP